MDKKQSRKEQLQEINMLRTDLSVALADDLLTKQSLTVDCEQIKEFLITVAKNKYRENIIKGFYYTLLSAVDMTIYNFLCHLHTLGKIKTVEYSELSDEEFAAAVKAVMSLHYDVSSEQETLLFAVFDKYLKIFQTEDDDLPF